MMRTALALGAVVGLALAATATAAEKTGVEPGMAAYIGADLQIDNLEGYHVHRRLAADHTYTETGTDGAVTGTWSLEGGKLCNAQRTPPPPPDRAPRYCNIGVGHKPGDKWQSTDPVTGNPIFFYLAPPP